ncbi:hypothetical protein CMV_001039 [Castanea mollissima]|uniref:Uncharacterized protein n=1 Tax=Castanea mollissima TaxID=60419 RepID=A0A8J4RYM9_9ROSI|nr:hypothetical protein CMV_001039 [Castanea mollissima]
MSDRERGRHTRPRSTSNHISLSVSHFFLRVESTLRVDSLIPRQPISEFHSKPPFRDPIHSFHFMDSAV